MNFTRTPYIQAWTIILSQKAGPEQTEGLRRLFPLDEELIDERGFTFLHKVVLGLTPISLTSVLQHMGKHEIDTCDGQSKSALNWAASRGDSDAVNKLLAAGADCNGAIPQTRPPLVDACMGGSESCIRSLLEAGARVNDSTSSGLTPFVTIGLYHDDIALSRLLAEYGADMDARLDGASALYYALRMRHSLLAHELMNNNVDIHHPDCDGWNSFHYAILGTNASICEKLLRANVDYTRKTNDGQPMLHWIAQKADESVLQTLTDAALSGLDQSEKWQGLTPMEMLLVRHDVTPTLQSAFTRFLTSVTIEPDIFKDSTQFL